MNNKFLELIRLATLAANGHNTQPWKFSINANQIQIHSDYTRGLPVVDPQNRALWINLGCALENLLIAARATGFSAEVTYPENQDYIDVRLVEERPDRSELFDAIPLRQNTRSMYDGKALNPSAAEQLHSLKLESGISLRFAESASDFDLLVESVNQGTLKQYADKAFIKELISWLCFNKKEALASRDGLYSRCSGNPQVPRFIGQMFVEGTKPQQQADADIKKLRSSSGAVVIASTAESKTNWVRTGQVYERLALKMTALDIKSALLNQPIEALDVRTQFQKVLGLGASVPQLLVRFGYAGRMPGSLRRPLDQVILTPKGSQIQ